LSSAFSQLIATAEDYFQRDPFEWYYCVQFEVYDDFNSTCLLSERVDGLLRRLLRVDTYVDE